MDLNDLEKLYADSFRRIEDGAILSGKILAIKQDKIIVDIGYKSEGLINVTEFTPGELASLKPGDTIEVFVEHIRDSEGIVYLSKDRASKIKTWDFLEEAAESGTPVEGKVVEKTKGGLFVDIGGVRAFLPGSQIDTKVIRDLDSLMHRKMTFKVLKISNRRSNVIVSRRAIIEEERAKLKGQTLLKIREGEVMEGTIKNITDYGVFVDLGGIDGLLHISDISWGRISHPSEFFVVGDRIEVLILKYDASHERVTLGYKQRYPDPWTQVTEKYPPGKRLKGTVVSITDYGAFIEVEKGLEGLIHVSELDWAPRPKHPSKYLSIGETVEAVVLKVDQAERKLSLSLKQTKASPWELISQRYEIGRRITGKIKSLTDFGIFIGLPEGVDGLVHISDISWTRHIKHPSEVFRKGQKIDAVVLALDATHEKMALGIKQLQPDPWPEIIPSRFRLGDEVTGKVLRITDFGVFVELPGEVEGLIYSSEIVPPAGADEENPLSEGQEVRTRIIKMDVQERKIGLSMKNVKKDRDIA